MLMAAGNLYTAAAQQQQQQQQQGGLCYYPGVAQQQQGGLYYPTVQQQQQQQQQQQGHPFLSVLGGQHDIVSHRLANKREQDSRLLAAYLFTL